MIRILLTLALVFSVTGSVLAESEPWLSDTYDANETSRSPAPGGELGPGPTNNSSGFNGGAVVNERSTAAGQAGGLVPCNGPDCNTCHVAQLANNVIDFLVKMLAVIAVIVMVFAGFKMVTSGGDEGAWTSGKQMFTNVVIGIIIVLAAWLIVDTLLMGLTGKGLAVWGKLAC